MCWAQVTRVRDFLDGSGGCMGWASGSRDQAPGNKSCRKRSPSLPVSLRSTTLSLQGRGGQMRRGEGGRRVTGSAKKAAGPGCWPGPAIGGSRVNGKPSSVSRRIGMATISLPAALPTRWGPGSQHSTRCLSADHRDTCLSLHEAGFDSTPVAGRLVRSYRTFSPLPPHLPTPSFAAQLAARKGMGKRGGGCFLLTFHHLATRERCVGVTHRLVLSCSDFPLRCPAFGGYCSGRLFTLITMIVG